VDELLTNRQTLETRETELSSWARAVGCPPQEARPLSPADRTQDLDNEIRASGRARHPAALGRDLDPADDPRQPVRARRPRSERRSRVGAEPQADQGRGRASAL